jgi:prevent-host-death family protein
MRTRQVNSDAASLGALPTRKSKTHSCGFTTLTGVRFCELVRRVRNVGPQHIAVHGRDEVVVVAVEEFRRLKGDRTGEALIAALQASPRHERLLVRDAKL